MVRRFSSRPEAAPCCGVLVRAALVDKSLKRHVTITVSGPASGTRFRGNVVTPGSGSAAGQPMIRKAQQEAQRWRRGGGPAAVGDLRPV